MTTWRKEIIEALERWDESWSEVESHTLSQEEIDLPFDEGYGSADGPPFTVWTKSRIYFPAVYDGSEWVASVSRNPDGIKTPHVGG